MAEVYTIEGQENLNTDKDQNSTFYYKKLNDDQKSTSIERLDLPLTSSFDENFYSSSTQPELYYVKAEQTNTPSSSSSSTSIPYESFNKPKPEVYYISIRDEKPYEYSNKQVPVNTNYLPDGKVTAYMIVASKDDESQFSSLSSRRQRKKKHTVSFNVGHGRDKSDGKDLLMESNDTSSNIRNAPLLQSKASDSIRRSMDKYRFGENQNFY